MMSPEHAEDDPYEFMIHYVSIVKEIAKRHKVSPDDVFDMQCEIIAADYIRKKDERGLALLDEKMEECRESNGTAQACAIARGLVGHLKQKGVTKENVSEYLDRRIAEFQEAARRRNAERPAKSWEGSEGNSTDREFQGRLFE